MLPNTTFVGRQSHLAQLRNIFDNIHTNGTKIVLVGGNPGIGKTTLISQFISQYFFDSDVCLYGKFNNHHLPSQGLIDAINHYARSLKLKSKKEQIELSKELTDLLQPNLKILHEFAPDFEQLTKTDSHPQPLPSFESKNRFNLVFNKLLTFITKKSDRLVFFLDDLHWADADAIDLIESVVLNKEFKSICIVGSYRNDEVGISHPLSALARKLAKLNSLLQRVDLNPLSELEARTLVSQYSNNLSKEWEQYVCLQANGNPLYIKQLVETTGYGATSSTLSETNVSLAFKQPEQLGVTDKLAEILILKFKKLSKETQRVLKLASAIGPTFSAELISRISSLSTTEVESLLSDGVKLELIFIQKNNSCRHYQFTHDKIRESIFELVNDKPGLHLAIGRQLQSYPSDPKTLPTILYHMNIGCEQISNMEETINVSNMNFTAAIQAKTTGSYSTAIVYLQTARKLLPIDSWTSQHKLSFRIYKTLAECKYLCGKFKEAHELYHIILERTGNTYERAEVHKLKIIQYTNQSNWKEAVDEGMEALKLFNIDLESDDETPKTLELLSTTPIDHILTLPSNIDPLVDSLISLCNSMVSPVYVLRPDLIQNLVLIMIRTSFDSGISKESAYAFDLYGVLVGSIHGDYRKANDYALLALKLNQKLNDISLRCKIKLTYYTNISPWVNYIELGINELKTASVDGLNAGDLINSGYCNVSQILQSFHSGMNLVELDDIITSALPFLEKSNNPAILLVRFTRQFIKNMNGTTNDSLSLSDDSFCENTTLNSMENVGFLHGIHWYFLLRMMTSVIRQDYAHAMDLVERSRAASIGAVGQFSISELNFYHSLILTGLIKNEKEKFEDHKKTLETNQEQLRQWAELCPRNFLHKFELVQAEIEACQTNPIEAGKTYASALRNALANGFYQDAAICSHRYSLQERTSNNSLRGDLLKECKDHLTKWGCTTDAFS
ncbi:MAG: AAA family ATPase [Gammaproteobacteria bacterium]|nr:AAA family ATPase [Gammaproteobacteria bacterium]MDH5802491.1 AAA family ATPase [Gammaproteobacteria bacterium]